LQLLKRILTAVVLIPIVLLLVLAAPVPVLAFVTGLVALLTTDELLKLSAGYGIRPIRWATFAVVVIFFVFIAVNPEGNTDLLSTAGVIYAAVLLAALLPFIFSVIAMRRVDLRTAFPAAMVSVFAFGYIALPLGLLVQVREQWRGAFLILYLLLIVWAGDIFAYFVGKSLGRHLMSPRISPKKTWEGAFASLAASLIIGALLFNYSGQISSALLSAHLIDKKDGLFALQKPLLWPTLLLSAAINIAAQLGDLVESLIKRGAGVKDSGSLLPGHGGMLDRIDALLFAAPILWYYAAWRVLR
jgi:phosphatidate cytidylyltransferase